jgi:hypothetical protein
MVFELKKLIIRGLEACRGGLSIEATCRGAIVADCRFQEKEVDNL